MELLRRVGHFFPVRKLSIRQKLKVWIGINFKNSLKKGRILNSNWKCKELGIRSNTNTDVLTWAKYIRLQIVTISSLFLMGGGEVGDGENTAEQFQIPRSDGITQSLFIFHPDEKDKK